LAVKKFGSSSPLMVFDRHRLIEPELPKFFSGHDSERVSEQSESRLPNYELNFF